MKTKIITVKCENCSHEFNLNLKLRVQCPKCKSTPPKIDFNSPVPTEFELELAARIMNLNAH